MDAEQMVDAMSTWDPQLFKYDAPPTTPAEVIDAAIETAARLQNSKLPPVFTLGHLASEADVPYLFLRQVVARAYGVHSYRVFRLKKASAGGMERYRWIASPHPLLLKTQRWINSRILSNLPQHPASYAYRGGRCAYDAAKKHTNARWLVKADVTDFFESILEPRVYRVFRDAGYQPLVAFEMTRLCTRLRTQDEVQSYDRKSLNKSSSYKLAAYRSNYIGHLPQGAATSPTLANLIASPLDQTLADIAATAGFRYTRYADDIAFSSDVESCTRQDAIQASNAINAALREHGLRPNATKAAIRGPGQRRLVLGLLVDGEQPRLTKQFKDNLTLHIRHLQKSGPSGHAQARGFHSLIGLKHHLDGLLAYARSVDSSFADKCTQGLSEIQWPVLTPIDLESLPGV